MSQPRIGLVFLSFFGVFEYSQERIQKKADAPREDALAFLRSVIAVRRRCL